MLDFRLLSFMAVWEEQSYTRAANRLGLTQPAVSQHIKALEDRLGTPLFRMKGRTLELTRAGEVLYRYASVAMADGMKTEAIIAKAASMPTLKFGATRTLGEYVLPFMIGPYLTRHPDAEISMKVDNTENLLDLLQAGAIDFAFIEGIFNRGDYSVETFRQDELVPVCSPASPLAGSVQSLINLLQERLLVREAGSGSRAILENALASQNLGLRNFERMLELGNIEAIKKLVMNGHGVAFLFKVSVSPELNSGLLSKIIMPAFSIHHDYSFVTLKSSIYASLYKEFLTEAVLL